MSQLGPWELTHKRKRGPADDISFAQLPADTQQLDVNKLAAETRGHPEQARSVTSASRNQGPSPIGPCILASVSSTGALDQPLSTDAFRG
ncbi:hypothetical protein [Gordonia sp. (in: high G+C Gram-positive bacteria)]|uniref:hypothetical protein n=1 Tax=Gordonia sp. (in: high G+C Gram-positive bacteria) TaxID=84139 RepID=UPI003F9853AF